MNALNIENIIIYNVILYPMIEEGRKEEYKKNRLKTFKEKMIDAILSKIASYILEGTIIGLYLYFQEVIEFLTNNPSLTATV